MKVASPAFLLFRTLCYACLGGDRAIMVFNVSGFHNSLQAFYGLLIKELSRQDGTSPRHEFKRY